MGFINIYTDTITAAADINPNSFVGIDGTIGASVQDGVTRYGGESGDAIEVMFLGRAQVILDDASDAVVAGDYVIAAAAGTATLESSTTTGYKVLSGGSAGELIDILLK